jgi:hypothetical protein
MRASLDPIVSPLAVGDVDTPTPNAVITDIAVAPQISSTNVGLPTEEDDGWPGGPLVCGGAILMGCYAGPGPVSAPGFQYQGPNCLRGDELFRQANEYARQIRDNEPIRYVVAAIVDFFCIFRNVDESQEPGPRSLSSELDDALGDLSIGRSVAATADDTSGMRSSSNSTTGEKPIESANFSQRTFTQQFGKKGDFAAQTVDEVAGQLRSGDLSSSEVPIGIIRRGDNTLILNTRSANALERAGIPRSEWTVVDRTGDPFFERIMDLRLKSNGLDETGIPTVRQGGGG